jgi:hypothetical protein
MSKATTTKTYPRDATFKRTSYSGDIERMAVSRLVCTLAYTNVGNEVLGGLWILSPIDILIHLPIKGHVASLKDPVIQIALVRRVPKNDTIALPS